MHPESLVFDVVESTIFRGSACGVPYKACAVDNFPANNRTRQISCNNCNIITDVGDVGNMAKFKICMLW